MFLFCDSHSHSHSLSPNTTMSERWFVGQDRFAHCVTCNLLYSFGIGYTESEQGNASGSHEKGGRRRFEALSSISTLPRTLKRLARLS
nr:MAG TPA: hypothetical protein [Caudoviricetes sp.]